MKICETPSNVLKIYLSVFIVLLWGLRAEAQKAENEMPIIAFWGIPENNTTDIHFQDFKECGFTVSLFPYSSLNALTKACRVAEKHGIKILGRCPEMVSSPQSAANALKGEEGFFGYYMQDEPDIQELRLRNKEIERLKRIDTCHIFYINLHPYYETDPKRFFAITKVKTYPEYLNTASKGPCQQISFDFYPITKTGMRETWFHNLEMVRRESLSTRKPFWGFVLSVPHNCYPQPTLGSLRLQAYSNLAYGAQAIQYFTYWTPEKNPTWDFHDAPISTTGRKTKTYALVKQMNSELKRVAKLFYGGTVTDVRHLGIVAEGTVPLDAAPVNIKRLKINGKKGVIVSQFTKDGHDFMAIVNKDYETPTAINITAKNGTPRHITKTLQEESLASSYEVAPGDILLFKLR